VIAIGQKGKLVAINRPGATVRGASSGRFISIGDEVTSADGDLVVTLPGEIEGTIAIDVTIDPEPADEIIRRARAFKAENDAGLLGHVPPAVKVSL
jgi:hypothetical protein